MSEKLTNEYGDKMITELIQLHGSNDLNERFGARAPWEHAILSLLSDRTPVGIGLGFRTKLAAAPVLILVLLAPPVGVINPL